MELKTPLYDCHVAAGGKIVPFAGYFLPVQYGTGVIAEHMAVREKAGLFDVSHMGEVVFEGPDALANINKLLANDYTVMLPGKVRYSPMCYDNGGIVDDLLVYKYSDEKYLIVVNASNRHKDVDWMKEHLFGDVKFSDISDSVAQLALQGPASLEIIKKLAAEEDIPVKYYSFKPDVKVGGFNCILSKTGYTGEDGFEIYCDNDAAPALWDLILDAGKEFGLIPCGLGARDTLRLEAAMPLYGHEMDETINPLEACLDFAVKLDKPDFIGKDAIVASLPVKRKRIGLKVTGRGIIREHTEISADGKVIGFSTSGTHCPYLGCPVAMAILEEEYAVPGKKVTANVRGREIEAETVALPFYKKK